MSWIQITPLVAEVMHPVLRLPLARAPERPLVSEFAFDGLMAGSAVSAYESLKEASYFSIFQGLPVKFGVAFIFTLDTTIRLYVARRKAACEA